ncbi:MAG TPA: GTPase [Sedimentisphaerales bacterium]|nr:GTPase [Sedimentisphaerales bacterium]
MGTLAALMTGRGAGAISTIEVFGDSAEALIKEIFKPADNKPATLKPGKILLGTITDGAETIDQAIVGCEGANDFAINCHGNPLVVEMIMELLHRCGAKLVTPEELLAEVLVAKETTGTIALEARLAQAKAVTLEGTKIILNQIEAGLNKKATRWLQDIKSLSLEQMRAEAAQVIEDSRSAKLIIAGCTAAIIGPPNTGKSTLLNCLSGRQKAIVTDVKGTTRDWVSARCKIGPLSVELVDTAGLDEKLAQAPQTVEKAAQQKTIEILEIADVVLLVLDNSETADQLDEEMVKKIAGKKVLTVLNKSDLPARFDARKLPEVLADTVQISAKFGTGIEKLVAKIPQTSAAADFNLRTAVCFTGRQENLLKKLRSAKSKEQAASLITELLNGRLDV